MWRDWAVGTIASGALFVGCASTVSANEGDARPTTADVGMSDVVVDAAVFDGGGGEVAVVDAGALDVGRDVGLEAHVCPVPVEEDVPVTDAGAPDGPYVVELAVGSQLHQCARMSDGTLRCRGWNRAGELGIGNSQLPDGGRNEVFPVPGLNDVEQVVTSDVGVTCTRHRDGTVRCWGSNQIGMLGTGQVGDETCSMGYPCRTTPTLVPGLTDVVFLAVAQGAICAVSRDGTVRCWGGGNVLVGSTATPTLASITDVAALFPLTYGWIVRLRSGDYVAVRVAAPGAEGVALPPQAEVVAGDTTFASHLCYRLPDGSARCLGENWYGKVGDGTSKPQTIFVREPVDPGLCGVRSVVTGTYNSCAVMADRTVRCWGEGSNGALGFDPPDTCVGLSGLASTPCATRPATVRGLDQVDRVFLGVWGGCALRLDHSVWCWGTLSPDYSTYALMPVEW